MMPRYDKRLGTVRVSVPKLNNDEQIPPAIAEIIGSSVPRVGVARKAGERADFIVTRGKLTSDLERMAARLGGTPVIMPEASAYLADRILAATTAGRDVAVYMVGGE